MSQRNNPNVIEGLDIQPEANAIVRAIKRMIGKAKAAGVRRPLVQIFDDEVVCVLDRDLIPDSSVAGGFGSAGVAVRASGSLMKAAGCYDVGSW